MEKAWRFEEVRNNTCVAWARMWICVHRCSQLKGGAWIRDKACKPHQTGRHMAMEPRRTISNAANFTKNIRNWLDTSLPPPPLPPFAAFTARIGATDSCITLLGNETLCVAWLLIVSGEEEDSSSFPFCDLIFTRFTSVLIIFQVLEFSKSFLIHFLSRLFSVAKTFRHISQKILLSESQSSSHIADFLSSYCQFFPLTIFQQKQGLSPPQMNREQSLSRSRKANLDQNSLLMKFKSQRQQQQQQQRDNNNARKKEMCSVLLVRNRTKPVTCESATHLAYSPPANEHKKRTERKKEAGERQWLRL